MTPEPRTLAPPAFATLRVRVEVHLASFLDASRKELAARDPAATLLVDEARRLIDAGGKRLRPAFCYWGYRAAGGPDDEPIIHAAAALELLHTMALIHDDLMDGAVERRGVRTSAPYLAAEAGRRGFTAEPEGFGWAAAILAGDLAAVLADRCFLASGFGPEDLVAGLDRYHRMRTDMAVGQFLDVAGLAAEPAVARRAAALKGGAYTVAGPLLIGAALAGSDRGVEAALLRFGEPLGEAFQLRDDLHDGEAAHGATSLDVNRLIAEARAALDPEITDAEASTALDALAGSLVMP